MTEYDIAVVGAGPVGLTLANLLARRGHRVVVLERQPKPYPRPRAVHFDDETARVLAEAGVADAIRTVGEPAPVYEWRNAAGERLLRFDWPGTGASGWPIATMFHQPDLERALVAAAADRASVTVLTGHAVTDLVEDEDGVTVAAEGPDGPTRVRAAWVVGCDGAGSLVRDRIGATVTDLGYFYDWLVVDVVPHEHRPWDPPNVQVCDPARPTTAVSGGPGRRRWEFMRLPGETIAELDTEATAWRLLEPWGVTARTADLERHAVYTFQARWADEWRAGRLLIAGDAAHLMPPFAGQGMCSGIRDAFMLGNGADPARILPPVPPSTLTSGVVRRDASGAPAAGSGVLTPQPRLTLDGRAGLLDELVGPVVVVAATVDPREVLSADQRARLRSLGAVLLHLNLEDGLVAGHLGVVIRPDHYLFAAAGTPADLADAVADLLAQLPEPAALAAVESR